MKKIMLTLLAVSFFLPNVVQAATFQKGDKMYLNQVINDDFYGAGDLINVLSDIHGDFYAAAGQVIVEGNISQDSMIVAGDAVVKGVIDDDLRAGVGTMNLNAIVKGDALIACGSFIMDSESFIGGDLIAAVGQALIDGDVNGNVRMAGDTDGTLHINSTIGGSVATLGFEHVEFGPEAKILGDFWYQAKEAMEIPEGVVVGEITFKKTELKESKNGIPKVLAGFSLYKFLSLLFFGLFLIWIFRYFVINATAKAHEATLKSIGVGFLILVLPPIAVLILMATIIGIPLALITLMIWLIVLYLGKVMVATVIGYKIIKVDTKSKFGRLYGGFALGALIYTLIGLVPLVGWLINFLFVLIAIGGLTSYKLEVCEQLKKKKIC